MEDDDKDFHKFLLRVEPELWKRFTEKLPVSISVNEKINTLIRDWVIRYEEILEKNKGEN